MSKSCMKTMTVDGHKYYGWLINSPDDGGYYIEIWTEKGGTVQTDVFDTQEDAWNAAKHIIILENRR